MQTLESSQHNDLKKIANFQMPFGKYKGCPLIDLPEPYVVWFHQNGLPAGELGRLLGLLYEIKLNGLEYLFKQIREQSSTEDYPINTDGYNESKKNNA